MARRSKCFSCVSSRCKRRCSSRAASVTTAAPSRHLEAVALPLLLPGCRPLLHARPPILPFCSRAKVCLLLQPGRNKNALTRQQCHKIGLVQVGHSRPQVTTAWWTGCQRCDEFTSPLHCNWSVLVKKVASPSFR